MQRTTPGIHAIRTNRSGTLLRFVVCLVVGLASPWAKAQLREATVESEAAQAVRASAASESDRAMLDRAEGTVRQAESALKEVFVAYKARHDTEQWRLGLPLVTHAGSGLGMAYDMTGKNMMAQWKHSTPAVGGGSTDYRAFVGDAGQFAVSVSRRF